MLYDADWSGFIHSHLVYSALCVLSRARPVDACCRQLDGPGRNSSLLSERLS